MFKKNFVSRYFIIFLIPFVLVYLLMPIFENFSLKNFKSKTKDLKVSNNILLGPRLSNDSNSQIKNPRVHTGDNLQPLKNVTFKFEGHPLSFSCDIYESFQRYYLPLDDFLSVLSGNYYEQANSIDIVYDNIKYTIDKSTSIVRINDTYQFQLRGDIILKNNKIYLSLSDIEHLFNLVDDWNYDCNEISLFKSKNTIKPKSTNSSGTAALIRLEDVAAGGLMLSNDSLKKMKIIADYFYSEGMKFHVAWIPRYKDPSQSIDNNLLENSDFRNAQFINMLDHLIFRGGVIGLHGYTHQHGNETSISSTELDKDNNNDIISTKKIVEAALETANKLNIPITFFESPHYAATELQQSVIENYFKYIYEPCIGSWNKMPIASSRNKTTIYVPAPLGYVHDNGVDDLINRILNREEGSLASFFYHPIKEFDYIKFNTEENGYISYTYSTESPMHKVFKTLKDNNYSTITIDEIK